MTDSTCDCEDPSQCWEPCGELGNSEEHAVPSTLHLTNPEGWWSLERMKKSFVGKEYQLPEGLSREEKRAYLQGEFKCEGEK
jgi:hypothetical protein